MSGPSRETNYTGSGSIYEEERTGEEPIETCF
jgi:hypothetical protein